MVISSLLPSALCTTFFLSADVHFARPSSYRAAVMQIQWSIYRRPQFRFLTYRLHQSRSICPYRAVPHVPEIHVAGYLPSALHARTMSACFCARGRLPFLDWSRNAVLANQPFSGRGSISAILMALPCFRQNSSKALSVTKVSTSFSCPSEISFCTSGLPTSKSSLLVSKSTASARASWTRP